MSDLFESINGIRGHRNADHYESNKKAAELAGLINIVRGAYHEYCKSGATAGGIYDEMRDKLYDKVMNVITPESLARFIQDCRLNDFCVSSAQFNLYGILTGVLLDILTEKERAEGREAALSIDGGGARFDMLFYGAKNIGRLFISNFTGNRICADIGRDKGKVDLVSVSFCSGDGILSGAGSSRGSCGRGRGKGKIEDEGGIHGTVIAAAIKGNGVLSGASNFSNIVGFKIDGRCALYAAGKADGANDAGGITAGAACSIAGFDITGPDALNRISGNIDKVIALNVNGHNALRLPEGAIRTMVCENVFGTGALAGVVRGAAAVETLAYKNTPALGLVDIDGMVSGEEFYDRYEKIIESTKMRAVYKSLAAIYSKNGGGR